ncbi:MAG: TraR/DksA C4-type zinc finger protein [Bacteroidota bacterium]|nr:TraR/DksA C4-type zinc finger protein [Bacteroidota bacterium]
MEKIKKVKQKSKALPTKAKPAIKKIKAVKVVAKTPEKIVIETKVKGTHKGYKPADLAYFKKIIMEKRKEILEELETLRNTIMDVATGEYTSENPTYSLHMEQGTDAMEREKTFLLASREGKFLNYLDDALVRIEKGEYGLCLVCGKLIEKERLEAVPHAQMCFNCKNKSGKK